MKCKNCQAELAEWGGFCPVCGTDNHVDPEAPEVAEQVPEQPELEGETRAYDGPEISSKTKKWKRIAAASGCVAVLTVLATVLFFGIRSGWDVGTWFDFLKPRENTVLYKDSYTVEDNKAESKKDTVVATMGDVELTNGQLQLYYWNTVYEFLNNYSYYLSYIGLDYTAPLDEQACYFSSEQTWQQYFLQTALETWQSNQSFALEAEKNGFQLSEEYQQILNDLAADLEETAQKNGYENADALLDDQMGPGCTVEDYVAYMEVYYTGYLYFAELYDAIDPSMEEIEAYFAENEAELAESGIKKDGTHTVDVRHILLLPEGATLETIYTDTFSDEAWEAARVSGQAILDEWLAGEATEDSFAALANEHSVDPGSNTNGGLYTGVAEGEMVEAFDSWCFDAERKTGDTALVKTELGYHVMFYSARGEESWITQCREAIRSKGSQEIVNTVLDSYEVEFNYKKIVLGLVDLAS